MLKKALVTGASSGIGYAFVERLVREGYSVTAVARTEEKLQALVDTLPGEGHSYRIVDLTDPGQVTALAKHLEETHYDLLVNNAGAGCYNSFTATPLDTHERIMQLNMHAVVTLAHAYVQQARRGDALVNVASVLAFVPYAPAGVYAPTKAFVLSLSEGLWLEQKEKGVYVMALCPGVTESSFHEAAGGFANEKPAAWLTQSADEVVEEGMAALRARKHPVIVSGWKNRVGLFLTRFLTQKRKAEITAKW